MPTRGLNHLARDLGEILAVTHEGPRKRAATRPGGLSSIRLGRGPGYFLSPPLPLSSPPAPMES
jgi:hypothetical protein